MFSWSFSVFLKNANQPSRIFSSLRSVASSWNSSLTGTYQDSEPYRKWHWAIRFAKTGFFDTFFNHSKALTNALILSKLSRSLNECVDESKTVSIHSMRKFSSSVGERDSQNFAVPSSISENTAHSA